MAYARKRPARKNYKRKTYAKSTALTKKISTIAKAAVMRVAETKHIFFNLNTGPTFTALYHNTPYKISDNMLVTNQGITDGDSSANILARIGDMVQPIGVKIYLITRQPYQNPNVNWRLIVLKTRGSTIPTTLSFKDITSMQTFDDLDRENSQMRTVLDIKWKDNELAYSRYDSTLTHNSDNIKCRKFWIPASKLSKKYHYSGDNAQTGRDYNLIPFLIAYDNFNDSTAELISTFKFSWEFFFKDV